MGQYQQWLHYHEVEQRLQAQLKVLENELAELQGEASTLEYAVPLAQNPIINALIHDLYRKALASRVDGADPANRETSLIEEKSISYDQDEEIYTSTEQHRSIPPSPLSPALRSWGDLPRIGSENIAALSAGLMDEHEEDLSIPKSPHLELSFGPGDLSELLDEHEQERTEPQLELPWWLHNIAVSSGASSKNGLIDQESVRTNQLIQRWLQRWGKQVPQAQASAVQKEKSNE